MSRATAGGCKNNDGLAPGTKNRVHTTLIRRRFTCEGGGFPVGRVVTRPPSPFGMNSDASELGRCPECGERIPEAWLLIKYETGGGETRLWAECPACETVVSPE